MTVADRIAVMDKGKIIQVATPSEFYEQPNSRYVASFIGDVNMFEGKAVPTANGVTRIECGALGMAIESEGGGKADAGNTAWFAVRPEKVRISAEAPPDAGGVNAVPGEVWDIAYLGDMSIFHVKLANGQVMTATRANVSRIVDRPIGWDDKVWLSWDRNAGVVLQG